MDVVAIQASPRPAGHSSRLLEQLLDALAEFSVLRIGPADLMVAPCRSCGACLDSGRCSFAASRLSRYLEALWGARLVLLASPVYFLGPPGPLKLFMDRSQPLWARTYRLGQNRPRPGRGLALLTAAGSGPGVFAPFEAMVRAWFHSLGIREVNTLSCGCLELDAALSPSCLNEARRWGLRLAAWLAASSGRETGTP